MPRATCAARRTPSRAGVPCLSKASQAKLFRLRDRRVVCSKCDSGPRGYGYVRDYPSSAITARARDQIYEARAEIQRMLIARICA